MSAVINPRAHELAHEFVAENWDEIAPATYDTDRSDLTFNVELFLTITGGGLTHHRGTERVYLIRGKAERFYHNEFAHQSHRDEDRLDIIQSIGYALLDYVEAPKAEIDQFELWYDTVHNGHLEARRGQGRLDSPLL